jgi:uncharacterized protein YkwD
MRGLVFVFVVTLGFFGQVLPGLASGCGSPEGASTLAKGLLTWINSERKARGLHAYRISPDLTSAAKAHACDMVTHGYFAHRRSGGPDLGHRIKSTGYPLSMGAENIAYTQQRKVTSVAPIWKNSPQHWHAILDPNLRDIGIALAESPNGDGPLYWVMDVGLKR